MIVKSTTYVIKHGVLLLTLVAATACSNDQANVVDAMQTEISLGLMRQTNDAFCTTAQQLIADTVIESDNKLHTTKKSFVKSKPREFPLVTHQYVSQQLSESDLVEFPISISCKLKTSERINQGVIDSGVTNSSPVAHAERTCRDVNQATWRAVSTTLSERQQRDAEKNIIFDQDDKVFIGPSWVKPWPYQVAYRDDKGVTHVRSKALHVEYSSFIPMPASFMGTHYCHLISPEYLMALIVGTISAPGER